MATKYYTGLAAPVSQVTKITFPVVSNTVTYTITVGSTGKGISVVPPESNLESLVTSLMAAWNSSDDPNVQEFYAERRIEAGVLAGIQLVNRNPGDNVTLTSTSSSGSPSVVVVTSASGPGVWTAAANWSGGTLPATGDTLILENSSVDIKYGLTDANNYAKLVIKSTFTGSIGNAHQNPNGYPEFRPKYLKLGTGANPIEIEIGEGDGIGSGRVMLDLSGAVTTAVIYKTGNPSNSLDPSADLINLSGASVVYSYGGRSKISGTVGTVKVCSPQGNSNGLLDLIDATVTDISCLGGSVLVGNNFTSLEVRDRGKARVFGAVSGGTVTLSSNGEVDWESSLGITNLIVQSDGVANFGKVANPKTVTNCEVYSKGNIKDPWKIVTWTNGVKLKGCRIQDVNLDLGFEYTL